MDITKARNFIFLKDVLILSIISFGGPHAHIGLFIEKFVKQRKYLSEVELMELYALCQAIPGPTSTQTITAIGLKLGGVRLAYFTLLVWALPACLLMICAAFFITYLDYMKINLSFTKFIQPMAVGFVSYSAYIISSKVVNTKTAITLLILSAIISYFFNTPWILPFLILAGGVVSAFKYNKITPSPKAEFSVQWSNFVLFLAVPIVAALIGHFTSWRPIRLFENFYRNGSFIFGGGQVLIPLLYGEFVEYKNYLTSQEFLSGYAFVQILPGPVFAFSSYIGGLSMRGLGWYNQVIGGLFSSAGIFLPGTFLIFFIVPFWNYLKNYRIIKASLEGINAVSAGLVISAAILLFKPIQENFVNYSIIGGTLIVLLYGKIPAPFLIIGGILLGIFL